MNQELGSGIVKLIFGGSKMSLVQYHPRDKDCAVVETLSLLMSNSDKSRADVLVVLHLESIIF
jgi:hypothetical protein